MHGEAVASCLSCSHFKGNSEEVPHKTNLISFSYCGEFISCLGDWRAAPRASGMAAHLYLSSGCSERLQQGFANQSLKLRVPELGIVIKSSSLLSFKQSTYFIYLLWLWIWLVSMLMVYQNLIRADEMNRNKEVLKYLKNESSFIEIRYAKSRTIWSICHLGHHCSSFKKRKLEGERSKWATSIIYRNLRVWLNK